MARKYAVPGSREFAWWYAQKRRRDRKAEEPTPEPEANPLLVDYPGAAAAYSLRDLTGEEPTVVRVRRSDNNAEQDFTAAQITDGTLVAFVGASNNGLVTTWYDQSGNDNHATQATAGNQPKIVSAGALVTENGKAALDFDGVDDGINGIISGLSSFNSLSVFAINAPNNASAPDTTAYVLFSYGLGGGIGKGFTFGPATGLLSLETICLYFWNNSLGNGRLGSTTYTHSAGEHLIHSQFYLSSGTTAFKNNSQIEFDLASSMTTSTNTSPANSDISSEDFYIGSSLSAGYSPQKIQEIILYPSDQSANRVGIETNINDHYEIFP